MADMEVDKFSSLLNNLRNSLDLTADLLSLKIYLTSLGPKAVLRQVDRNAINLILECMTNASESQLDTGCDILMTMMGAIPAEKLFDDYQAQLLFGLKQKSPHLKVLCSELLHKLSASSYALLLNDGEEHITLLIDCLTDDADSVHKSAAKTLTALGRQDDGANALFSISSSIHKYLKHSISQQSSTVFFRFMQVIVDCCASNQFVLTLCDTNGMLLLLMNQVRDTDDVLSQAVAMEMCGSLAMSQHGYHWLVKQGVLDYLSDQIEADATENPFAALTQPVVVKVFSGIASRYPERLYADAPTYFNKITSILVNSEGDANLALEAMACTASTVSGKQVLEKQGPRMRLSIQKIGKLAREANSSTKLEALNCIGSLLGVARSATEGPDSFRMVESLTESWFSELDAQPLEFLLAISRRPFKDHRLAVLNIYMALCNYMWGIKLIRDHPSFKEYLIDRSTEQEKDGREMKYELISMIVKSPYAIEIMPGDQIIKLKVYLKQGPFYVQATSQVAMEEG